MGDPMGIGPEIIQKSLPKFRNLAQFKVFGDPQCLSQLPEKELSAISVPMEGVTWTPPLAGQAAIAALELAMESHRAGEIQGLVTAPISKAHMKAAGFPFPGHTEYLAAKTGTEKFVMMMVGPRLKVTLVTIHEPLARVSSQLTQEKILDTLAITYQSLQQLFGIKQPKIAVCGLNPHAGEEGILGSEEREVIGPAIASATKKGYPCSGPRVPDAVFYEAYQSKWDAVVCMYHDQGLIPFKMVHFKDGVNVTLGLPLVRTSPDHGTAFDIAGKGIADSSSMEAALRLAIELVSHK